MASEKQINYINSLIAKFEVSNNPWLSKDYSHLSEQDRRLANQSAEVELRRFVCSGMGLSIFSRAVNATATESLVSQYNAKIAELKSVDLVAMDSKDASKLIDTLKRGRIQ